MKQKVELLEAFTGFETANKYKVLNSLGQVVDSPNNTHYGSISGILFHLNVILNLRAVSGILINESNNCGGVPLFFN